MNKFVKIGLGTAAIAAVGAAVCAGMRKINHMTASTCACEDDCKKEPIVGPCIHDVAEDFLTQSSNEKT